MGDERLRTAADFFGFVAYLVVMSGGLPDSELLSAAYRSSSEGRAKGGDTARLRLVEASGASPAEESDGLPPEAESEADAAVA